MLPFQPEVSKMVQIWLIPYRSVGATGLKKKVTLQIGFYNTYHIMYIVYK